MPEGSAPGCLWSGGCTRRVCVRACADRSQQGEGEGDSPQQQQASPLSREERLRLVKERQEEQRARRLQELEQQAQAAQHYQKQVEEERRRRIEEARHRDHERRQQVEERKRLIWEADHVSGTRPSSRLRCTQQGLITGSNVHPYAPLPVRTLSGSPRAPTRQIAAAAWFEVLPQLDSFRDKARTSGVKLVSQIGKALLGRVSWVPWGLVLCLLDGAHEGIPGFKQKRLQV